MRSLFLLLILLSGCVEIVSPVEMQRAEAACRAHGGLSHIRVSSFYVKEASIRAFCNDGTEISRLPERGKR